MNETNPTSDLQLLTLGCVSSSQKVFGEVHSFRFHELCLMEGGESRLVLEGREKKLQNRSLIHIRPGVEHVFEKIPGQRPRFWALFFRGRRNLIDRFEAFSAGPESRPIWKVNDRQATFFKTVFVRLVTERAMNRPTSHLAERSLLELLLVRIQRWTEAEQKTNGDYLAAAETAFELSSNFEPKAVDGGAMSGELSLSWPGRKTTRLRF